MRTFMRIFQRIAALALLIALGAWLFYIGREHRVFLDNKTVERDGKSFRALEQVNVSVNGGEAVELMPRDRDMAVVVGPEFVMRVEVCDADGEVERVIEMTLTPGFEKDLMVSLPLLAAARGDFLLPPPGGAAVPAPEPEPDEPAAEGM